MLKQRIITALMLGLPVIAVLLWLPRQLTILLFAIVVLMAGWEWSALARIQQPISRIFYLIVLTIAMWCSWRFVRSDDTLHVALLCVLAWWILALLWILFKP